MKWVRAFDEIRHYKETNAASEGQLARQIIYILASYMTPEPIKEFASGTFRKKPPLYMNADFTSAHTKKVRIFRKYKSILNNDLYNGLRISPLPSLLHIDDRASMAHSVESRAPFLDHRLVEYVMAVPSVYKVHDGWMKWLLR